MDVAVQEVVDRLASWLRLPAVLDDRFLRLVAYSAHDHLVDEVREASREAVAQLREAGLRVRVSQDFSPTVEPGHVISTDPERGERVRRNAVITLVVSQGPERVAVPPVAGLPLADAKRALTEAGLTPGRETGAFDPEIPQGSVISTDPAAGTERRPDSAVALVVSRGVEIPVADVLGRPESDAARELNSDCPTTIPARKAPRAGETPNHIVAPTANPNANTNTVSVNSSRERVREMFDKQLAVMTVEGIDFVGVARGLGVDGELVEKHGDLLPAVERAINAGIPYLLEVVVDPKVPKLLS
jgi:hypothetical protein